MGVAHPSEVNAAFADGFNRRDVDAMLSLYDPEGAVVEMDGTMSIGAEHIRDHLERLVELGGHMVSTNLTAIELGDIALVTAEWVITDTVVAPRMDGRSAEVLRRQHDGTWAYLIDQPA
jgi:ketosteroid isomerase-like protein